MLVRLQISDTQMLHSIRHPNTNTRYGLSFDLIDLLLAFQLFLLTPGSHMRAPPFGNSGHQDDIRFLA